MLMQAKGLIIKETNLGENDKVLVILTKEYGIIHAFANGARKMKSKNSAATSLLCYADFSLYKSKDTYKVNDANPLELFFNLRYDLEALSLAQYFCELVLKLVAEDTEPNDFLKIMLNSLYFLTNKSKPLGIVKAVTELKLISLAGYMPDLITCAGCSDLNNKKIRFSLSDGCIFCEKCLGENVKTVPLNSTVLAAMRHIVYSDFNKIYSFMIPDKDLKMLNKITEEYVCLMSEYHYKTLDFYKSVRG